MDYYGGHCPANITGYEANTDFKGNDNQPRVTKCNRLHFMVKYVGCALANAPCAPFHDAALLRRAIPNIKTAQECCAACSTAKGCTAVSFGPLPTFGCRPVEYPSATKNLLEDTDGCGSLLLLLTCAVLMTSSHSEGSSTVMLDALT